MISYLPSISEKYKNITKDMNVNLCSSLNKLDGIIKGQFKVLPSRQKYSDKNIVYEIQCRDYDATYVG